MNKLLTAIMREFTPKVSKEINGTIDKKLEELPTYLDDVFRNGTKILHPGIPLKYVGWERMSPKEEIKHMTTSRYVHDMADSNIYMVKFKFNINGNEVMEKPIYLPYADLGNIVRFSGTRYVMSYILSDRSLSPSLAGLFLKLNISKLNFTTTHKVIIKNNEKITVDIKNSKILLLNIIDKLGNPITPTFLYLLCRYGMSYFDKNMKVFLDEDGSLTKELELEYDVYTTQYHAYGGKPRRHMNVAYRPHCLCVAVPKGTGNIDLISAIIYSLDMLPDLAKDVVKVFGNIEKEKEVFIIMLSRILYKESYSMYRMLEDTKQHLNSLEGYLDLLTKNNLKYVDIHVNDFYELLYELVTRYQDLVVNFKDYHNNLNNKYMDVNSYIGFDVTYPYNKIMLRVNRRGPTIASKEITKNFAELSPKKIFSLVKSSGQNLALSVLDNSSDLIYVKATSIQEDQSRGDGVKRGRNNQFPANIKTLSAQQTLIGSLLYLIKAAPTGVLRRNMFLNTHPDGNIIVIDEVKKIMKELNDIYQLAPTTETDGDVSELLDNIVTISE